MIKIKDYIFPEENILYIRQQTSDTVTVLRKRPNEYDKYKTELEIKKATFEDIEWNYGNESKAQISLQNQLVKQYQRIDKAIEYINDNVAVYGFNNKALPHWEFDDNNIQDLLKILKGEENESN